MPFVYGFLRTRGGGHVDAGLPGHEGEVDPGFGIDQGGSIDNSLPPGFPPIHGNLPAPPIGVWPPLTPSAPIQPAPPGTPPGAIWPSPGRPDRPSQGLPGGGHISGQPVPPPSGSTLPETGGGSIDNTLPSKVYWVIAGIPGVGWRYVCVDPSLSAGSPLPPAPAPKV
jgi:hypothetical protein